ncbi:MAG: sterol desaturase family protein, partial [Aestuariivirgaceae bacterium]
WIAAIHLRNLALLTLVAGGLHLYFYTWRGQGRQLKFDPRDMATNGRSFLFGDQVLDNIFWSLATGVAVWTAYEAAILWGYANGRAPLITWDSNPVWFIVLFLAIPVWKSFHFYWGHRLLHWPPLYRSVHKLHHRNINIGPWSGMAMHPLEQVIYLSSLLIHWVVPSHPVHLFFHGYFLVLVAATSHTGFEGLLIKDKNRLALGNFFHQLHHRYFECNYGNAEMPWDKWFGSFHNGTPGASEHIRERRRRMHGLSSQS